MEQNPPKKPNKTIQGRNLRSMLLLGIFLLVGTCLAAGQRLYRRSIEMYTEYAYSYAQMIADSIDGSATTRFMETGEKDEDFYDIRWMIATSGIYEEEFRDFYLVIPTEEDLIYVCEYYHNLSEEELAGMEHQAQFLEHRAYQPGEKEVMMRVLEQRETANEDKLYMDLRRLGRDELATALVPIHAEEGEVPALVGIDISVEAIWRSLINMYLLLAAAIALITAIGVVVHYRVLDRTVIQPITSLKTATDEMVNKLDSDEVFLADIHTGDEVEDLAHAFEEMDGNLKRYIRENTAITAERERISTELSLAARIQENMLPREFPPFPDRREMELYASMDPAKEVGGDFYDFFFVDEDRLCLVIADVSGKGIPAALFMMMAKIMLKNWALAGLSPKETMERVNDQICRNNAEEMFVTVWMGILDLRDGSLVAVNAGHEYPILKQPEGLFELVKDRHGLVVGGMEGVPYREYTLQLEPGSVLFVYTDGLPEATNAQNRLFGADRILRTLNAVPPGTEPKGILETVQAAADDFVGTAPQFDDLTMLCIEYRGPAERKNAPEKQNASDAGIQEKGAQEHEQFR